MPTIDTSKPLILGFAFSCATENMGELVNTYKKAGISPEDIDIPSQGTIAHWRENKWPISVYASGSEEQLAEISAAGFDFEMGHVLGPYK